MVRHRTYSPGTIMHSARRRIELRQKTQNYVALWTIRDIDDRSRWHAGASMNKMRKIKTPCLFRNGRKMKTAAE
ncbi:MAG: hypothetical protein II008_20050 [Oscillospiraceae bacterium]|nr:hypothetical protein [Oscillospiraceae bacterium]